MNKDETVAFTRKVMSHLCGPNQVRGEGELPAWEQRLFVTQLSRKTQDILAEVGHQRVKMRCVLCIFLNFNVNHFQFNSFRHLLAVTTACIVAFQWHRRRSVEGTCNLIVKPNPHGTGSVIQTVCIVD